MATQQKTKKIEDTLSEWERNAHFTTAGPVSFVSSDWSSFGRRASSTPAAAGVTVGPVTAPLSGGVAAAEDDVGGPVNENVNQLVFK